MKKHTSGDLITQPFGRLTLDERTDRLLGRARVLALLFLVHWWWLLSCPRYPVYQCKLRRGGGVAVVGDAGAAAAGETGAAAADGDAGPAAAAVTVKVVAG